MKVNIHWVERFLRIVIGAVLIAWPLGLLGMLGVGVGPVWAWIGVVPLLTGLLGWCPPYAMLGISTCKKCD